MIWTDVLEYFKDDNGNFVCYLGEADQGVTDMFNLYRFSQLSFPGERILREAKAFAGEYLKTCVQNNQVRDKWSLKKSLKEEVNLFLCYRYTASFLNLIMSCNCSLLTVLKWKVNYAPQNPWVKSLQRVDVREYIKQYGENDVWISKSAYR